jgi:hypothetical protein
MAHSKERNLTTIRERLESFWSGDRPDRIPFTTYENKIPSDWRDSVIQQMFEDGLGVVRFVPTWKTTCRNVEIVEQSYVENGEARRRQVWRTPVGEIDATWIQTGLRNTSSNRQMITG